MSVRTTTDKGLQRKVVFQVKVKSYRLPIKYVRTD